MPPWRQRIPARTPGSTGKARYCGAAANRSLGVHIVLLAFRFEVRENGVLFTLHAAAVVPVNIAESAGHADDWDVAGLTRCDVQVSVALHAQATRRPKRANSFLPPQSSTRCFLHCVIPASRCTPVACLRRPSDCLSFAKEARPHAISSALRRAELALLSGISILTSFSLFPPTRSPRPSLGTPSTEHRRGAYIGKPRSLPSFA
jgi:hypothetical protein